MRAEPSGSIALKGADGIDEGTDMVSDVRFDGQGTSQRAAFN